MSELLALILAGVAGGLLGLFFFGGLWWTVRQGLSFKRPVVWFLGSLLLRTAVTLIGFYFVGRQDWRRFVACLAGFIMARLVVLWLAPSKTATTTNPPEQEMNSASES